MSRDTTSAFAEHLEHGGIVCDHQRRVFRLFTWRLCKAARRHRKSRTAFCIAARICPFCRAVVRGYFVDNPVNTLSLPKRFRRADEAFSNVDGRLVRRKKLRKLKKSALGKGTGILPGDCKTPAPPVENKSPVNESSAAYEGLRVAAFRVSELAPATSLYPIQGLLRLDLCPLLPAFAVVSVASISTEEMAVVRQAEENLRFVLPRDLIKRAYPLLGTEKDISRSLALNILSSQGASGEAASNGDSRVACTTIGKHPSVQCSTAFLTLMSSVKSCNEQLKLSRDTYLRKSQSVWTRKGSSRHRSST